MEILDTIEGENLSPVDKFYKWHAAEMKDLEENGPKKRRGRKPSKKQYFTYITDQAIIAYNFEPSWAKRNKVFREHINYPFNKLVEIFIIHLDFHILMYHMKMLKLK